jgi:hypothetical protein
VNAPAAIELVVARCGEDCAWLRNIPPQLAATIYDKSEAEPLASARRLPNVGREAHTYLFHLVERYDSLAPLTVFCQGKPFDHAFDFHTTLRDFLATPDFKAGFHWLGHMVDWDDDRGRRLFVPWSKNPERRELDVRDFYRALFGSDAPTYFSFRGGAQFAVTAELVRSRPRSFYEHALELSATFTGAAHCLERMWDQVFGVQGVPQARRGKTVFLKPTKAQRDEALPCLSGTTELALGRGCS